MNWPPFDVGGMLRSLFLAERSGNSTRARSSFSLIGRLALNTEDVSSASTCFVFVATDTPYFPLRRSRREDQLESSGRASVTAQWMSHLRTARPPTPTNAAPPSPCPLPGRGLKPPDIEMHAAGRHAHGPRRPTRPLRSPRRATPDRANARAGK